MRNLLVVLILAAAASAQVRLGVSGGMPINMGHKFPQIGGVVSYRAKHFEISATALSAYKFGAVGGPGASGVISAGGWYRYAGAGARYSWLVVRDYHKAALRPFVSVGKRDLNAKYVHFGGDRLNRLQAALFEWRTPVDDRWRFGIESGPTFAHATNNPARRHVGFVMSITFDRRMGK